MRLVYVNKAVKSEMSTNLISKSANKLHSYRETNTCPRMQYNYYTIPMGNYFWHIPTYVVISYNTAQIDTYVFVCNCVEIVTKTRVIVLFETQPVDYLASRRSRSTCNDAYLFAGVLVFSVVFEGKS